MWIVVGRFGQEQGLQLRIRRWTVGDEVEFIPLSPHIILVVPIVGTRKDVVVRIIARNTLVRFVASLTGHKDYQVW
ncbi:MAG: hypothetical protein ACLQVM_22250 [Terriglobia bacterium]